LTAVLFYFRRPHIPETETLKQFCRVEKYANEAETVSVFYFSFISPCATAFTGVAGNLNRFGMLTL